MSNTPQPPAFTAPPVPAAHETRVRVLSVLVEDGANTLSKVSGLIRRRGFHVRSISGAPEPPARPLPDDADRRRGPRRDRPGPQTARAPGRGDRDRRRDW